MTGGSLLVLTLRKYGMKRVTLSYPSQRNCSYKLSKLIKFATTGGKRIYNVDFKFLSREIIIL